MTGVVRDFSDANAFHLKLDELGTKPKGYNYQYLPDRGDINAVKSRGRFLTFIGLSTPGTGNQAQSVEAIGKLIAKHVLFLDKERDYYPLIGLKREIEQLKLTDDPLYEDLDRVIRIIEEDTTQNKSVWDLIPRDLQLRLLSHLSPEEMRATAKANKEFETRILDPIIQAASRYSSKPSRPKVDITESVDSILEAGINLDVLRSVYSPYLEIPLVRTRVATLANNIQEYYRPSGISKPEQINPKFAGYDWNDIAFLEMKIRGQPIFEL